MAYKVLRVLLILSISSSGVSQSLKAQREQILSDEFRKELVHVTDGIYTAVGFGASNCTLIEGTDGLIIVDTMMCTESAKQVMELFRKISQKPVEALIYTHSHTDHIGGASVFAGDANPDIYAGQNQTAGLPGHEKLADIIKKRSGRQFGSDLSNTEKIPGIAPVDRPTGGYAAGKLEPTYKCFEERTPVHISGIDLELLSAPGETNDHLYVWIPAKKVLICGDNFYCSFPNLYAIRGTPYRDVSHWIVSLNKIIDERPDYLISGHARPISGSDRIIETVAAYRDAISFVLGQTLEGMNLGLTPDQLAKSIKLPENLTENRYLQEYYGVVEWSTRAIYHGFLGWFDGNPTNLFPLSPTEEAERMVGLVGSREKLLETARNALKLKDYQWVCQLCDYFLALDPESRSARAIKAQALEALGYQQVNSNARHYYLSSAKELKKSVAMAKSETW